MMNKSYDADVIVIGGGPIGLASAYFCAKQGNSVILLEKFSIGNQQGSSAEHVRMWRIMYTELNHAKLAIKSGEMFQALEKEADVRLLHKNGLLNFGVETGYTPEGTLNTAVEVMDQLGKKYTRLNKRQIEDRYPFKNLPDDFSGVYQEEAATIDVKETLQSLLRLNKINGVDIRTGERVVQMVSEANGVIVRSETRDYVAKKVILCPGSYVNELIYPSFGFKFNILLWEMCFAYYRITDPTLTFPMWFQFDQPRNGHSNLFYGFPEAHFARKGFVRLAVDWASHTFMDPHEREFSPRKLDIQLTREYVMQHMKGLDAAPIDMGSALMTHFPDNLSVLDFLPKEHVPYHKNIVLCTGGWAFKFTPLFGKICADLVNQGETDVDIREFSILRDAIIQPNERKNRMKHSLFWGVIFSLLSAFCYSALTTLIKINGVAISVPILVFIQSAFCLVFILPIMFFKFGRASLNLKQFSTIKKQHLFRTVFSLSIGYCLFLAIKKIPYFDAVLLYNAFPLFVPVVAFALLGTKMNKRLWPFILMGFLGVALTMNIDVHLVSLWAVIALLSAVCAAGSIVMMRKISATDNSLKSLYYYFFISTIISGVIAIPEFHEITQTSFMLLMAMSVLFFFVQYFLVLSATYTTAQVVSSTYYSNIIFSLIFSIFLLNNALSLSVIIGMVLIVVGGVGVIFLQKNLKKLK